MGKFLTLITIAAMALFIAGPAMAQEVDRTVDTDKTYNFTKNVTVNVDKDVKVNKDVDIKFKGEGTPTGDSDFIFKELDVEVQDTEVVNKLFELDDFATSEWKANGNGLVFAAEQFQLGEGNVATLEELNTRGSDDAMLVGLQYQVGNSNTADLHSTVCFHKMNNFAKQIQIGNNNTATGIQD